MGIKTLQVQAVTDITFLLTISIHHQENRLGELINDHQKENDYLISYLILPTSSLRK